MTTELEALRGFWDELFGHMMECMDLDGGTFQDMGEKHRLIISEKYDPDGRHKDISVEECERDEDCFFNVFGLIDKDFLHGWFSEF